MLNYSKKDLKKYELKNAITSILLVAGIALGAITNSSFALWVIGILYALIIMIIIFGTFLLNFENIKEIISKDESTGKGVVNVMYSNNLYKFILTAIEIAVFTALNLPIFVIFAWVSLGVSLMYKSKLKKMFEIKDVTNKGKNKKQKTKFKDRDNFNKIMNSKNSKKSKNDKNDNKDKKNKDKNE